MQTDSLENSSDLVSIQSPLRCLLVDDEPLILMVLSKFLANTNTELVSTSNAADAITAAESERFDILITDRFMPGMDGMTLAKILKRRHPYLKTIVISGIPPSCTTQIDAFLQKPFTQAGLLEIVHSLTPPEKRSNQGTPACAPVSA
ncbi:MAG: response regulator [Verrucomicrobiota bacterium]